MTAIPEGLCQCGCGKPTRLAWCSDINKGWVRGKPLRFLSGHRPIRPLPAFLEEDRGHATPCWIWQGGRGFRGYGRKNTPAGLVPAHRWYWEEDHGPVPDGLELDHLCFTPSCVNPSHLEPVTPIENHRRSRSTKLTVGKVREIRQVRADGLRAAPRQPDGSLATRLPNGNAIAVQLGERYGVSRNTIRNLWRGKGWADALPHEVAGEARPVPVEEREAA